MQYLFEETAAIRPSRFFGTPSLWNNFCADFKRETEEQLRKVEEKYFGQEKDEVENIERNLEREKKERTFAYEGAIELAKSTVRLKFRSFLGDRIQQILTGADPPPRHLLVLPSFFSPSFSPSSSIVYCSLGTAKIAPVVLQTLRQIFVGTTVIELYGATGKFPSLSPSPPSFTSLFIVLLYHSHPHVHLTLLLR